MQSLADLCLNKIYKDDSYDISILPQDLIDHIMMKKINRHYKINPSKVYLYNYSIMSGTDNNIHKQINLIKNKDEAYYNKKIYWNLIFYVYYDPNNEVHKYIGGSLSYILFICLGLKNNCYIAIQEHPLVNHIIAAENYYAEILNENDIHRVYLEIFHFKN